MTKVTPVILCGGGGTRLWPLSTPRTPKQFLPLTGPQSMVAETLSRVSDEGLFNPAMAVGSFRHKDQLQAELPGVKLVLEPMGRNTAPAIYFSALTSEPDDALLVMPSDHWIEDTEAFAAMAAAGEAVAADGGWVNFGVIPDAPTTGYG